MATLCSLPSVEKAGLAISAQTASRARNAAVSSLLFKKLVIEVCMISPLKIHRVCVVGMCGVSDTNLPIHSDRLLVLIHETGLSAYSLISKSCHFN